MSTTTLFDRLKIDGENYCREYYRAASSKATLALLVEVSDGLEEDYGRPLQAQLSRRLNQLNKKFGRFLHLDVRVRVLVDHNAKPWTCAPLVTIGWADHGGRFDFEALVPDRPAMERLLKRVEQTLKINLDA